MSTSFALLLHIAFFLGCRCCSSLFSIFPFAMCSGSSPLLQVLAESFH
jgi:hypothetical protein